MPLFPIFKPASRQCGYRIHSQARAGLTLGPGDFAMTTYALSSPATVGLPQPQVAYWGPGDTIPSAFGGATVQYGFVGGVVFRNC